MRILALALTLLLPGVVAAQAASYTYINQKAPYSNPNPPWLTARNLPKLGSTFTLDLVPLISSGGRLSWSYALLAIGGSNPNTQITPLGGFLFSSAEVVRRVPSAPNLTTRSVRMDFRIPNNTQLLGARFFQQVLVLRGSLSTILSARLSRGSVGVIGQ